MHEHGLTPYTHGYYNGYNKEINPSAASGKSTVTKNQNKNSRLRVFSSYKF